MASVSPTNNLKFTHPKIASLVVKIYNKDGSVSDKTVEEVSYGSKLKAEFRCPELGHGNSIATITDRTHGRGCPICSGQRTKAGVNDLKTTHPTLASLILKIYDKDGSVSNKTVQDVSAGMAFKAEFRCPKPELGHQNSVARINDRTSGRGCPVCSGKKVEKGINDLTTTHPEIASSITHFYNKDGSVSNKTVEEVNAGSHLKAEFRCPKPELGHENFIASIANRTRGRSCPLCALGKTEGLFRDSFNRHTKNNFVSARIPLYRPSFKSGMIQIDMLCTDLNTVIEYDGAWVHGGVNNPNKNITTEECLARDVEGTIALIKGGFKVIRIRDHNHEEKLQFIKLPEEYADSLYQITYKSFSKDKDDIDTLVKKIIKAKQDWF